MKQLFVIQKHWERKALHSMFVANRSGLSHNVAITRWTPTGQIAEHVIFVQKI
jgi:hypothetical protein